MGVIYRVKCEQCGSVFQHQAGVGFAYACVGCGEGAADEDTPFCCPVCNKRYNPREKQFGERVQEVTLWD